MGQAMLGNYRFRLDPSSVSWDFKVHVRDVKTIGGKVVQVLGTSLGDMTVTGSFGKGGHREQVEMLRSMSKVGDEMMYGSRTPKGVAPIRFVYPPRKWDFRVYLRAFSQPGDRVAAHFAPEIIAPGFMLTLFIVEDNANLKKVAQDAYISRLSAGLGWKLTEFNAPGVQDVAATIAAEGGIKEYLTRHLNLGGTG